MKTSLLTISLWAIINTAHGQTVPQKADAKKKKTETSYIIQGNQKAFIEISNKENPPHPPIVARHDKPNPTDTSHPHK